MKILASNSADCNCSTASPLTVTEWARKNQYLITDAEFRAIKIDVAEILERRPVDEMLTIYAQLNRQLFQLAKDVGAIAYTQNAEYTVELTQQTKEALNDYRGYSAVLPKPVTYSLRFEKIAELINGSIAKTIDFAMSISYLAKHTAKYWRGACSSRNAQRTARKRLAMLGVYKYDAVLPGSTYTPALFKEFDVIRALIVYETIEQILCRKQIIDKETGEVRTFTLDDLPHHRGAFVQNLFNHVFAGVATYNRDGYGSWHGTDTHELEPKTDDRLIAGFPVFKPFLFSKDFWKANYKKCIRAQYLAKRRTEQLRSGQTELIPENQHAIPY